MKYAFLDKLGLFVVRFCFLPAGFLVLAKAFRNGHVVACSTARRSATANDERRSYVTGPRLSTMTQHISTVDWIKN